MEHYNSKADEQRRRALADRDPLAYYKACNFGGFQPEDIELYNEGIKLIEAHLEELDNSEKALKLFDYENLINETNRLGLNPENIFEHIPEKANLLEKIMGYSTLKGDERSLKTLVNLDTSKTKAFIGNAFKNDYHTAKKILRI